jgi:hypothetical protein
MRTFILLALTACSTTSSSAPLGGDAANEVDGGPDAETEVTPKVIRGRFESAAQIRTCRGPLTNWNAPDGVLVRMALDLCGDDMQALAETIVGALDTVQARDQKAMLALGQGTNLPAGWLATCETFHFTSGNFSGDVCVPWDPSYQAALRTALTGVIGPAVRNHPALAGVYMTMPTSTNGFELHFRVPKSTFPYPGDAIFRAAHHTVMDIYQEAFSATPIVFEAGHCLWSDSPDCGTLLDLYRYSRDGYGVERSGISLWNCAERFWAGTGSGPETFGALALIEEASNDGASVGCQTVGSFTNGACRFTDPDVGEYGTNDEQTRDECPVEPSFDPEGACVDTMRWFAGVEAQANSTAHVVGTWAENWSAEFRAGSVYETSAACKAAIDLLAP